MLRALGYSTVTPEQDSEKVRRVRKKAYHAATSADLIEEGLVEVGMVLCPLSPLYDAEAQVLPGGRLLVNGKVFDAVSPAAAEVAGGTRNGWEFWGVSAGDGSLVWLKDMRTHLGDTSDSDD